MPKVMLVTGASRGIGAATARLAGRRGYAVVVNYLGRRDAADAVVVNIEKAGSRALAVQGDVADESTVKACLQLSINGLVRSTSSSTTQALCSGWPGRKKYRRAGWSVCSASTCSARFYVPGKRCGACRAEMAAKAVSS